jgi:signal transduction histidine kinase
MTPPSARRTVSSVTIPYALRSFGVAAFATIVATIFATEPTPGVSGDDLLVSLALIGLAAGVAIARPWAAMSDAQRIGGIVLIAVSGIVLTAVQPNGAGSAAVYLVVIIATMRLPLWPAAALSAFALGGEIVATALVVDEPGDKISGLLFSIIPWFLVIRLMRQLRSGRDEAEALVDELRESREETAQAAAVAERSRLARDMHDVLAHSLSALALQLEGARLLARDRDADPEVVAAVERAHHLAAGGLAEARQAIAALRGDELPGPERLPALAEAFGEDATAACELTVTGEPRELSSEARLALYRTAQEALTNVRRHSAAERVELRLHYAPDGTTLTVQDHGPGAPVAVGARDGGGYGLTGMRERAELLGGRLSAGPADDGFRVELWLPA